MDDKSEGSVDGRFFIERTIYSTKELSMRKQNDGTDPQDLLAGRYVDFEWQGNSSIVIKEGITESLDQPKTAALIINTEIPRNRALKALHDINWFVQNSWPEKFHTWADMVKFEKEQKEIARESHQRGERILSEFTKELSKEDLRSVEEAMRSYIDYINYYDYYLPK